MALRIAQLAAVALQRVDQSHDLGENLEPVAEIRVLSVPDFGKPLQPLLEPGMKPNLHIKHTSKRMRSNS